MCGTLYHVVLIEDGMEHGIAINLRTEEEAQHIMRQMVRMFTLGELGGKWINVA
jgi:hypothetical protein